MKILNKADIIIHSSMCMIGGFLGAYTIINRCGNLGSAQTMNMIDIVLCIFGNNFGEFFSRLFGLIIYIFGVFLYSILVHKTKMNMRRYSIIIDMIGFAFLCFIPADANPILSIYPIFFMLSTQWSVFHGNGKYNSSTIFSTNNLRQAVLAFGDYLFVKDKALLKKSAYFANSILWFHIGVATSFFACSFFGIYAVLFCYIPAFVSLMFTFINVGSFNVSKKLKNRKNSETSYCNAK